MTIRRKITHEFQAIGSDGLTVGVLVEFLKGLDEEARVEVKTESPDRPGEQTVTTVTVMSGDDGYW